MDKKRKRNHSVLLRFSGEEVEFLQKKMNEAGLKNREAYLRKMALEGVANELSRIGNNLNQIAKIANTYHEINPSELNTIEGDINKIWQLLISQG